MCNRIERLLKLAYKASLSTPSCCRFSVGAVLTRGSRVLSTGYNKPRTHPASPDCLISGKIRTQTHAEVDAISSLKEIQKRNLEDCTLYVIRRKVQGNGMGMAKPCPNCMKFLIRHGIRDVWYTDHNGKPCHLWINKQEKETNKLFVRCSL